MTANDITIAVTVYDRRTYLEQAIQSALDQTVPVRVIVVEDRGPDDGLQEFVTRKFGSRIVYHRNARRRGLFDNMNACLELCATPWLSILHDDDYLEPTWVEAMLELAAAAPGRLLYHVTGRLVDAAGRPLQSVDPLPVFTWEDTELSSVVMFNAIWFQGHLFNREAAVSLGGFRAGSMFCGDWEMWFKLILRGGASKTHRVVVNAREHDVPGKGTARVVRNGRKYCCDNVQRKRNVALLAQGNPKTGFDRVEVFKQSPMPLRFLLANAAGFTLRFLRYNASLYLLSNPARLSDRVFRMLARTIGPGFIRFSSRCWNAMNATKARVETLAKCGGKSTSAL